LKDCYLSLNLMFVYVEINLISNSDAWV